MSTTETEISLIDPKRVRSSLRTIQQAVEQSWNIPAHVMEAIPRIVSEILFDESASTRDRLRAAEVIASLVQSRVNAAVVLDKIERLNGGEPTERFVVPPDIQERVQAILSRRRLMPEAEKPIAVEK